MKSFSTLVLCAILFFGFAQVYADSDQEAKAFFDRIAKSDLIINDVSKLSHDELREMIKTTHDFCRYGKALRLEEARSMAGLGQAKSVLLSQSQWDARYYEINFNIDFATEIISGYTQVMATSLVPALSSIELDFFDNMSVDSVKMAGASVPFTHTNNLISITLDGSYDSSETFSAYVYYHGHPTEGGFQAFEFGTHNGTNMATTLSEPYFARTWWPCKDAPDDKVDSIDIIITHPSDFICASNGLVTSITDNGNGTKTTHWHHHYPIATYLACIGVTDYANFREWYVSQQGDSMPVDFYVYPEELSQAQISYPITVAMIDTLSRMFGEYPFISEKYGMLQFNWGGAMEHQTNTSINSGAYYESIILHELSHQWWGDMITCQNWHEIWLNEGFASYMEALWFEATQGFSFYKDYMDGMSYTYGGTIWCQDTTDTWAIFSTRVYDKGAWVLHMLRHFVGDSTFFEIMQTYYDDPRFKWGTINTAQFRDLCIQVSGDTRLQEFFQDWIWGTYYPQYRYSYNIQKYNGNDYMIYVHLRQTQNSPPLVFDMPIDLYFDNGDGVFKATVYNDQREQDFIIYLNDLNYDPYAMYFDTDNWILKTASSETYGLNMVYDRLDSAQQYVSYIDSIIVRGGTKPYKYSITSGSLPAGLALDSLTGRIAGNPTDTGTFAFTARVRDASNPVKSDTANYALYVRYLPYKIGDANEDGAVNVSDAVYIINFVFAGGFPPKPVLAAGDANCDGLANVSDAVWIINYVFTGGPAPGNCK